MDADDTKLKQLKAKVALAKSEVTVMGVRVKVEAQSEIVKTKTKARRSRRDRYEAAMSDIPTTFAKLDISSFGPLEGSRVEP